MSERQVSVDGRSHPLPRPFIVIATQNPVEFKGTYPLPESQLDRFLLRIPMGYPSREVELQVLASHRDGEPVDSLAPSIDCRQVVELQDTVRHVAVDTALNGYLLEMVLSTRRCEELHVGASTRARPGLVPGVASGGPHRGAKLRRAGRHQDAGRTRACASRNTQGLPSRRPAAGGGGARRAAGRGGARARVIFDETATPHFVYARGPAIPGDLRPGLLWRAG